MTPGGRGGSSSRAAGPGKRLEARSRQVLRSEARPRVRAKRTRASTARLDNLDPEGETARCSGGKPGSVHDSRRILIPWSLKEYIALRSPCRGAAASTSTAGRRRGRYEPSTDAAWIRPSEPKDLQPRQAGVEGKEGVSTSSRGREALSTRPLVLVGPSTDEASDQSSDETSRPNHQTIPQTKLADRCRRPDPVEEAPRRAPPPRTSREGRGCGRRLRSTVFAHFSFVFLADRGTARTRRRRTF